MMSSMLFVHTLWRFLYSDYPSLENALFKVFCQKTTLTNLYRNGKDLVGACQFKKLSTIKRRASFSKNGETRGLTRNRSFLPGLHGDPTVLVLDWSPLAEFLATSKKEEILAQNKLLPTTATTADAAKQIINKKKELERNGDEYTFSNKYL